MNYLAGKKAQGLSDCQRLFCNLSSYLNPYNLFTEVLFIELALIPANRSYLEGTMNLMPL